MAIKNTLIITEVRVYKVAKVYYADGAFITVLNRYQQEFGHLTLLTRVVESTAVPKGFSPLVEDIAVQGVPSLKSLVLHPLSRPLNTIICETDFVVLRMPSIIGIRLYSHIRKSHKKYMTEVMGCIWDAYWHHGIIGKILAPICFLKMRRIVKNADYCLYVTQSFLQKRYPCRQESIGASNVNISSAQSPKGYSDFDCHNFSMLTAAALDVKYKGQRYVLKAIKQLKKNGINITYYLAGKGNPGYLAGLAKRYKIQDNVIILGMLDQDSLKKRMRDTDIYIQPSLQEGLPRALIEAMSQGCVCLGARTAGIPELLDDEAVFKRKSAKAIVLAIKRINREELEVISARNVQKSKEYLKDELDNRRKAYFQRIIHKNSKGGSDG